MTTSRGISILALALVTLALGLPTAKADVEGSTTSESGLADSNFRANAPAPGDWGFAQYGPWVRVADGSDDWYRIRARSDNGVDFQMQVEFKDANGRSRIVTSGGLQPWVDYTIQGVGRGSVRVRFKVSTLGNDRGAAISGSVH